MKFYKYLYTYSPHAIIIPWGRGSRPQTKSDSGVIMENLYTQIDLFVTTILEGLTNGMGDADDAIAKAEDLAL